jgi:hypothetical protein
MTLDEARGRIGRKVVYVELLGDGPGRTVRKEEEGVITFVNDVYVFVRYGASMQSQATRPEDLETVP